MPQDNLQSKLQFLFCLLNTTTEADFLKMKHNQMGIDLNFFLLIDELKEVPQDKEFLLSLIPAEYITFATLTKLTQLLELYKHNFDEYESDTVEAINSLDFLYNLINEKYLENLAAQEKINFELNSDHSLNVDEIELIRKDLLSKKAERIVPYMNKTINGQSYLHYYITHHTNNKKKVQAIKDVFLSFNNDAITYLANTEIAGKSAIDWFIDQHQDDLSKAVNAIILTKCSKVINLLYDKKINNLNAIYWHLIQPERAESLQIKKFKQVIDSELNTKKTIEVIVAAALELSNGKDILEKVKVSTRHLSRLETILKQYKAATASETNATTDKANTDKANTEPVKRSVVNNNNQSTPRKRRKISDRNPQIVTNTALSLPNISRNEVKMFFHFLDNQLNLNNLLGLLKTTQNTILPPPIKSFSDFLTEKYKASIENNIKPFNEFCEDMIRDLVALIPDAIPSNTRVKLDLISILYQRSSSATDQDKIILQIIISAISRKYPNLALFDYDLLTANHSPSTDMSDSLNPVLRPMTEGNHNNQILSVSIGNINFTLPQKNYFYLDEASGQNLNAKARKELGLLNILDCRKVYRKPEYFVEILNRKEYEAWLVKASSRNIVQYENQHLIHRESVAQVHLNRPNNSRPDASSQMTTASLSTNTNTLFFSQPVIPHQPNYETPNPGQNKN